MIRRSHASSTSATLGSGLAKVSGDFFTVPADGDQTYVVVHAQIDFGRRTSDQGDVLVLQGGVDGMLETLKTLARLPAAG